jgi:hypothetical protein
MKRRLFLTLFVNGCIFINAQVPQGFNYQSIARGSDGKEITNTKLEVEISILSDTNGFNSSGKGNYVWEELQTVITNGLGLFTLTVGNPLAIRIQGTAASFSVIDWKQEPLYIGTKINYGGWKNMGTSPLWSVPYAMVAGDLKNQSRVQVSGNSNSTDSILFEVKNRTGQTIFAVYEEGVRIYVNDGVYKGHGKGGFAIGGFGTAKGLSQPYFVVDPDSIRAYIDNNPVKARKGGFAIGGFDKAKALNQEFLSVSDDSIRMYINDTPGKARKGGFAIGGFDKAKGGNASFLNVETDLNGIIDPSQNRILWYPLKNAFLTGKVLIEKPDSVGENSFATGYESKAKGKYSQALGYKAISRGDYSTAIGRNAIANSLSSFSFGNSAQALNESSFAFGTGAMATGINSYAFGSVGIDTLGFQTGQNTISSGNNSIAIGMGSQSTNLGAFSFGTNNIASGEFSIALGNESRSLNNSSIALGTFTKSIGFASTAVGYSSEANENFSTAIGFTAIATGNSSTSIGMHTTAGGVYSVALGNNSNASGYASTAMGDFTIASGSRSTAMGTMSVASTDNSTAIGWNTTSSGAGATAIGVHTTAQALYSTVLGCFNIISGSVNGWVPWEPVFVIGNGNSEALRSNAMTVLKNGNVGIGITAPTVKLHVNGDEIIQGNIGIGTTTPTTKLDITGGNNWDLVNGNGDVRIGNNSYRLKIGVALGGSGAGAVGIMQHGQPSAYNVLSIGAQGNFLLFLNGNSQNVGIGTDYPGYKLTVNGTAWCSSGSWTGSDIRWKKNIKVLDNTLSGILNLQAVNYDLRRDEFPEMGFESGSQIGLIAQDVEKVFPLLVNTDNKGYKAVAYDKLSVLLVEGMKEQQRQIQSYKAENENLRSKLESLQEKVDQIESMLAKGGLK